MKSSLVSPCSWIVTHSGPPHKAFRWFLKFDFSDNASRSHTQIPGPWARQLHPTRWDCPVLGEVPLECYQVVFLMHEAYLGAERRLKGTSRDHLLPFCCFLGKGKNDSRNITSSSSPSKVERSEEMGATFHKLELSPGLMDAAPTWVHCDPVLTILHGQCCLHCQIRGQRFRKWVAEGTKSWPAHVFISPYNLF